MDSDRKLAWAIFISLGCHFFILLMAVEFAPWRRLKAGNKSPIVIQLNDLSIRRTNEKVLETSQKKKTEKRIAKPEERPVVRKDAEIETRQEEKVNKPEPAAQPVPEESAISDQVLIRDRNIGTLLAEPQNEGTGSWHAEYARELRVIIKENQRYPIMAIRNRQQGTVMVGFILNRTGELLECHITRSCQHEILDRAALRAVRTVKKYPPFPDSVDWEQAGFVVPVSFVLE